MITVVLKLDFGLLAFPAVSPLAGAVGCSPSETAFTSVNPYLESLDFRVLAVYAPTAINHRVKHSKTLQLKGTYTIAKIL